MEQSEEEQWGEFQESLLMSPESEGKYGGSPLSTTIRKKRLGGTKEGLRFLWTERRIASPCTISTSLIRQVDAMMMLTVLWLLFTLH